MFSQADEKSLLRFTHLQMLDITVMIEIWDPHKLKIQNLLNCFSLCISSFCSEVRLSYPLYSAILMSFTQNTCLSLNIAIPWFPVVTRILEAIRF